MKQGGLKIARIFICIFLFVIISYNIRAAENIAIWPEDLVDLVSDPSVDTITLGNDFVFMMIDHDAVALPAIDRTITIMGNGHALERYVDLLFPQFRLFEVKPGGTLHLNDVILRKWDSATDGGAIYNEGRVTITDSLIDYNKSDGSGGAIYNTGSLEIIDSRFFANKSVENGGAIVIEDGSLTLRNTTFLHNKANEGGALRINENTGTNPVVEINDSEFAHNSAIKNAGAISNTALNGQITIYHSTIAENKAAEFGGGIGTSAPLEVYDSTFSDNNAEYGGAIWGVGAESYFDILDCTFFTNNAQYGGAIAITDAATVTLTNSRLSENIANLFAGAAYLDNGGMLIFRNGYITHNRAENKAGGAIFADNNSTIHLHNSTISDNSTPGSGGAIYLSLSVLNTAYSVFANNTTLNGVGGAVGAALSTIDIHSTDFWNNQAKSAGGALFIYAGLSQITQSNLISNRATHGGAIYRGDIDGKLIFSRGRIINNVGGGIDNNGDMSITESTISGNQGIAIANQNGDSTVFQTTISNNVNRGSGALYNYLGTVDIVNSTFSNNRAAGESSVIYTYCSGQVSNHL